MERNKKIIVVIVAIIVIISIYAILKRSQEKNIDNDNISISENRVNNNFNNSDDEKAFKTNDNYDIYYAVKGILENYKNCINYVNGTISQDYDRLQMSKNEILKELKEEGQKAIVNTLDEEYINEFNIERNTIGLWTKKYKILKEEDSEININKMYIYEEYSKNINLVLIYGSLNSNEFNCLIKMDLQNKTYSMYLNDYIEKYKYSKEINKKEININNSYIEKGIYNSFNYINATNEYVSKQYFNLLKTNILTDSKKIYSLLNEEYKKKRFSTYEKFQTYLTDMKDKLNNMTLSKYLVENNNDGTIRYNLLDNYENCYVVTVSANDLLDYNIQLDDYTLEKASYIEEYNKAESVDKANTNIAKFFKMINNKDYEAAYNVLDETYRKNNFSTLDKFKYYVKTQFFDYTTVTEIKDVTKSSSYYVCTIVTSSRDGKEKTETFVVSLEEGTNFKLSFTVK